MTAFSRATSARATLSSEALRALRRAAGTDLDLRRVEFVGPQVGEELRADGGAQSPYERLQGLADRAQRDGGLCCVVGGLVGSDVLVAAPSGALTER